MTVLLGKREDAKNGPIICFICGRWAKKLGICLGYDKTIGWLCDDPACLKAGPEVYKMSSREMDRVEQIAIHDAMKTIGPGIFEAVLDALFDGNIRSLDDLTEEKFGLLTANLSSNVGLKRALQDYLLKYSDELRKQITGSVAPF